MYSLINYSMQNVHTKGEPYGKTSDWTSKHDKEAKLGAKLTEKNLAILEKMDLTDRDLGFATPACAMIEAPVKEELPSLAVLKDAVKSQKPT